MALNLIRLGDEELGDQQDHQDYEECLQQFEEAAKRSTVHKVASIGAVLSSCPVELPKRLRWLLSGRFLRLLSAVTALAVLAAILYNAMAIDRVPPTFTLSVSNSGGSSLARTLTSIDVTFSEPVQAQTAQDAFSLTAAAPGSPKIEGAFHWQGRMLLIFTPAAKLTLSTKFRARVGPGVEDIAGNAQSSGQDLNFTTVGSPMVASVAPPLNTQSVPVDASIQITFDRPMDTQKVIGALSMKPEITYQVSWNGPVLTIAPTSAMAYGTTYTISIGDSAVDQDGSSLPLFATTFATVGNGLRATSLIPSPNTDGISVNSQIAVVFDGPIDPSSIGGAITLKPAVSGSTKVLSLSGNGSSSQVTATSPAAGGNLLVFTPDGPLAADTTYSVTLSPTVKRTDGQADAGQSWRFITGAFGATALNQIAFISRRSGVDNVWLMNADGSNQHEVTSELQPTVAYDISGDGTAIVYSSGGVVKLMSITGGNVTTLTQNGDFEYAPTITPDGTAVIVGRRDSQGVDDGYWRYPLTSGSDTKQLTPDGAPSPNGVNVGADGLTGRPGQSAWASRAALTADGKTMLLVRGADDGVELVDTTGAAAPIRLSLQGNSSPVWDQANGVFYLSASSDQGVTWGCRQVALTGSISSCGPAGSDVANEGSELAVVYAAADGSYHLSYESAPGGVSLALTTDATYREARPSFSPNGSVIAFARVGSQTPFVSAGIWTINVDGTGLTILSTDGSSPDWVP